MNLSKEIILKILNNFGVFSKKSGIIDKQCKLPIQFIFEYDDSTEKYDIWAGQLNINEKTVIKCLYSNFSNENYIEHNLIIGSDTSYGLQLLENESSFKILQNNKWINANTIMQAKVLIGSELILSHGLLWEKLSDYTTLYDNMLSFIEA